VYIRLLKNSIKQEFLDSQLKIETTRCIFTTLRIEKKERLGFFHLFSHVKNTSDMWNCYRSSATASEIFIASSYIMSF